MLSWIMGRQSKGCGQRRKNITLHAGLSILCGQTFLSTLRQTQISEKVYRLCDMVLRLQLQQVATWRGPASSKSRRECRHGRVSPPKLNITNSADEPVVFECPYLDVHTDLWLVIRRVLCTLRTAAPTASRPLRVRLRISLMGLRFLDHV